MTLPEGDAPGTVHHPVGLTVAVGQEEVNEDVGEEGELPGDVQQQQLLRQAAEEPELQRGEEGRVYRPQQYDMRPQPIEPGQRLDICEFDRKR